MLTAIATVLLSFLFTGIVGNRLLHGWQHRNWLEQQRILENERSLKFLQDLFDEVASLAGQRQHRMFRLLASIQGSDTELLTKRFTEYDNTVIAWNEKIIPLYAKLTIEIEWSHTKELESINGMFVSIGRDLQRLFSVRMSNKLPQPHEIKKLSDSLNVLQGRIGSFHKKLLRFISNKRSSLYEGIEIREDNLDSIPTGELFKALFQPRVKRHNVF